MPKRARIARFKRNSMTCSRISPDVPRRCNSHRASPNSSAVRASTSSAKTCCTPARTKSTTAIGQGLLAVRMGKPRVIAETGAGQHGVATATIAAHLGLECIVYMGTEDMERQRLNVFRMRMLGAEVIGVDSGSRTLKDAINEAMRDWVTNVRTTHYLLGSVLGAHPYPHNGARLSLGHRREAREQILARREALAGRICSPASVAARTPSGFSTRFSRDASVKMVGVEAGGRGKSLGEHAARLAVAARILRRAPRRPARHLHITFCKLPTAKSPPRIPFPRASTIPRSARSTPGSPIEAAPNIQPSAMTTPSTPRARSRAPKALFPRSNPRTPSPELIHRAPKMSEDEIVILNLSGRGDKDMEMLSKYV